MKALAGVFQTTVKYSVTCRGAGVHSAERVRLTLRPAPADTGVVFRRVDLLDGDAPAMADELNRATIRARYDAVTDTRLSTRLENEHAVGVSTVEHLMAALAGCGVDNVFVDVDAQELPIMDGSSAEFVKLIDCAGVLALRTPRRAIKVVKDLRIDDGEGFISFAPADQLSLDVQVDYADPAINQQRCAVTLDPAAFKSDIARARTFGFLKDVEALQQMGLARGGSLENSIVVDDGRILNQGGLRFSDEFARHKALDLLGDLYLAGAPIVARITANRPGHGLNNKALRALMADRSAWIWIDGVEETQAPAAALEPQAAFA